MNEEHNKILLYVNKLLDIYDSLDLENRRYIEVEIIKIIYNRYKDDPLLMEKLESIADRDILEIICMGL